MNRPSSRKRFLTIAGAAVFTGYIICPVVVVAASLIFWLGADRNVLGTLVEFSPRWPWLVPVGLMAAIALKYDSRLLVLAAIVALVWVGPLTGFCISASNENLASDLRILTLNTDGIAAPQHVMKLVQENAVDVVCLQECRKVNLWGDEFPAEWTVRVAGQYLVASRFKISELKTLGVPETGAKSIPACKCEVETDAGTVELITVHAYSPRGGLNSVRYNWQAGLSELSRNVSRRKIEHEKIAKWPEGKTTIIAGDFNQSAGSLAFAATWSGFVDCFSYCGNGWGNTFYTRWHSIRIDHILVSDQLEPVSCFVEEDVGSAHRPVIAVVRLK